MRLWLFLAGISGCSAVALGAFAAHGITDAYAAGLMDKASRYQILHALALLAVAWLSQQRPSWLVLAAGGLFTLGSLLFCGSLYVIALTGVKAAGAAAPFGGTSFMLGWLALSASAIRR